MMMSFLPFDASEPFTYPDSHAETLTGAARIDFPRMYISYEKLQIPVAEGLIERPRLHSLLKNSTGEFPATLLSGRSGTGKTALAAEFARSFKTAAWYTIEPCDIDWRSFSSYALASVRKKSKFMAKTSQPNDFSRSHTELVSEMLSRLITPKFPSIFVLDNVHYLFDTAWFGEFLTQIVSTIPANSHVLMLSRSKPPNPLWRLRSKRFLNVIDERVFAFDEKETEQLFSSFGLPKDTALETQKRYFGKVSQMLSVARSLAASSF